MRRNQGLHSLRASRQRSTAAHRRRGVRESPASGHRGRWTREDLPICFEDILRSKRVHSTAGRGTILSCPTTLRLGPALTVGPVRLQTRGHVFRQCALGVASLALASLLTADALRAAPSAAAIPGAVRKPHFTPRAKAVIYLFMAGGPSELELFDHKP